MNSELIAQSKLYVEDFFSRHKEDYLTYHNYEHTESVFNAAYQLSLDAELEGEEAEVLVLAAIFHDTGYLISKEEHEKKSGEIAREFLNNNNYDSEKQDRVVELINATKLGWMGKDKLAFILRDADLNGLAMEGYEINCMGLLKEQNHQVEKKKSSEEWLEENIRFFEQHKYLSKVGKKRFNKGKKANLEKLKKIRDKGDNSNTQTIASSKTAQTQLKTSLRNHIDLSSIADNKANIMLSVNAMVLTVGLPLLLSRLDEFPQLLIPVLLLALSSIVSMVYATLATRPISMAGTTDISKVMEKKTNLFFFGNFYNMSFDKYEEGIKQVISDNDVLDNSITRDLFFLGKSLGKKYDRLRVCYNVFMYGVGVSVISGIITFSMLK